MNEVEKAYELGKANNYLQKMRKILDSMDLEDSQEALDALDKLEGYILIQVMKIKPNP